MSNSMKTLNFIASVFAIFIYFTLTAGITASIGTGSTLSYYLMNFITLLGFLVMLCSQAVFRILFTRAKLKNLNIISKLTMKPIRFVERLSIYVFPAALTLVPIVRNRSFLESDITTLVSLLIFIIIVEILFYLNRRTMKIYITNNGLVITGIDLRLDTPFPSNHKNPSGYYSFERLQSLIDMNDKLVMYQSYDAGAIEVFADRDELKKLKGLLLSKHVVEKRY